MNGVMPLWYAIPAIAALVFTVLSVWVWELSRRQTPPSAESLSDRQSAMRYALRVALEALDVPYDRMLKCDRAAVARQMNVYFRLYHLRIRVTAQDVELLLAEQTMPKSVLEAFGDSLMGVSTRRDFQHPDDIDIAVGLHDDDE